MSLKTTKAAIDCSLCLPYLNRYLKTKTLEIPFPLSALKVEYKSGSYPFIGDLPHRFACSIACPVKTVSWPSDSWSKRCVTQDATNIVVELTKFNIECQLIED